MIETQAVTCPTCQGEFSLRPLPPMLDASPARVSPIVPQKPARNDGTMKTVRVVIVCVTALIGLLIWKCVGHHSTTITAADGSKTEVDVDSIKRVLATDKSLGDALTEKRKQNSFQKNSDIDQWGQDILEYVSQAKQTDISACPKDFAEAYYRHLGAWETEAMQVQAHPHIPDSYGEAVLGGMLRGLNGDVTGGSVEAMDDLKSWESKVKDCELQVSDTWNNVWALAVRYGAR